MQVDAAEPRQRQQRLREDLSERDHHGDIDPEIADNRELDSIKAITLSYTYFASKAGQPVAEDRAGTAKGDAKNPKL